MTAISRGGKHQPPEFIVRRVCGECGIIPPFCDHHWDKQIVERYVPESDLRGAVEEALAVLTDPEWADRAARNQAVAILEAWGERFST